MRNLLIILLCLIWPATGFAQLAITHPVQADYEYVVGRFMSFYNNNQTDSIINLYSDDWGDTKKGLWSTAENNEITAKYGKMKSYKYLELYRDGTGDGGGDGLAFFKVVFDKSTHIMGITLSDDKKLETFRFNTSSPHIDSLLSRN